MIRKISSSDRQLFIQLSEEFYHSSGVLHPIPSNFHSAAFDELMRSDVYLDCYIFEQDGKAAGFGLLNKMFCHEAGGITVWVEELYIRPEFQGAGIGSRFLSWVEDNIPAARYRLEVEPENTRACALYKRFGYDVLPYLQMYKDTE